MSLALGVSRTALWKHINALRKRGYKIDAVPGRGYRLRRSPELSPEDIRLLVKGPLGKKIVFLDKTPSTNDLAMSLAEEGAPYGTVVIADSQSRGKGRMGRRWLSQPKSNIYMSVIIRPKLAPRDAPLLTLLTAVSCALAVGRLSSVDVSIKWPNDLMVGAKKLGGILLETRSEPDRVLYAVLGIGINVNQNNFPKELSSKATSLRLKAGKKFSRTELIAEVLTETGAWLKLFEKEGRDAVIRKWRALNCTLGKKVKVTTGEGTVTGLAADIDAEGRLVVKTRDGKKVKVVSGDLATLR